MVAFNYISKENHICMMRERAKEGLPRASSNKQLKEWSCLTRGAPARYTAYLEIRYSQVLSFLNDKTVSLGVIRVLYVTIGISDNLNLIILYGDSF